MSLRLLLRLVTICCSMLLLVMCCDLPPAAEVNAPLCAHASYDFQVFANRTSTRSVIKLLIASNTPNENIPVPDTSLAPLRGTVLNHVVNTTAFSCPPEYIVNATVFGCSRDGQQLSTVVTNQTICCSPAHVVNATMIARVMLLVRLVLDRWSTALLVDYIPRGVIKILNSSYHTCSVPYDNQFWDFKTPSNNFGVVVSAIPHATTMPWPLVPMWAQPCAWDNKNRPLIVQLNVNPLWLNAETSDTHVMQEVQHHLLHALGFFHSTSLGSANPQFQAVWEQQLQKGVYYWNGSNAWSGTRVSCSTSGIPFDDEIYLASIGQYPNLLQNDSWTNSAVRQWASHFESRVVGSSNPMGNGAGNRWSWSISNTIRNFINSRFSFTGIWFTSNISSLTYNTTALLQDCLYAQYLNTSPVPLERLLPPAISLDEGGQPLAVPADCSLITSTCSRAVPLTRDTHFCFPDSTLGSSVLGSCSPDRLGMIDCTTSLSNSTQFVVPPAYNYSLGNMFVVGSSAEADFCPLVTVSVLSSIAWCKNALDDFPKRGNNYSSRSRCFASNITLTGPRPAPVASTRCFNTRCPYGIRVEVQVNGSSVWIPCDVGGASGIISNVTIYVPTFSGAIVCPAASDVCGSAPPTSSNDAQPIWDPSLDVKASFQIVSGYALDYLIVGGGVVATRDQGSRLCGQYSSGATNASLGFIPDFGFASVVAAAAVSSVVSSASLLWLGATGLNSWDSLGPYSKSTMIFPAPLSNESRSCYALNVTAVLANNANGAMVAIACSTLLPAFCTRPWNSTPSFIKCPVGARCFPTSSLANASKHRVYFVANNNNSATLMRSAALLATSCAASYFNSRLFDLDNLTQVGPPVTTPTSMVAWYQALFSVTGLLSQEGRAMWTGLTWANTSSVPSWSMLVQNWPSSTTTGFSPSGTYCFLLTTPGVTFQPLKAVADCDASFPGMCYSQNPALPVYFEGYNFEFYLNHVPLSYNRMSSDPTVCASFDSNAFLSPILDDRLMNYLTPWYSQISGTASSSMKWLLQATAPGSSNTSAIIPLFAGTTLVVNTSNSNATLLYPMINATGNTSVTSGATSLFAPRNASSIVTDQAIISGPTVFGLSINDSTTRLFRGLSPALEGAYVCARPLSRVRTPWTTTQCGNASQFCDVLPRADSTFSLSSTVVSHDEAIAQCASLTNGGLPLLWPASNQTSFVALNNTLAAVSTAYAPLLKQQLFWVGLRVVNGTISASFAANTSRQNATYDDITLSANQFFSSEDLALLIEGTCMAGYLVTTFQTNVSFSGTYSSVNYTGIRLRPMDCRQRLLSPCKSPFTTSPTLFVPWKIGSFAPSTSVSGFMSLHSFAVISSDAKSLNASRRACQGMGGDLAWLPNSVDSSNTSSAVGNIAQHPSMPTSSSAKLWLGFSLILSTTVRSVYETFGTLANTYYTIPTPGFAPICVSITVALTVAVETNCSSQFNFICMRPVSQSSVTVAQSFVMSNVTYQANVVVPAVSVAQTSCQVGIAMATNLTSVTTRVAPQVNTQRIQTGQPTTIPMPFSFLCTPASSSFSFLTLRAIGVSTQDSCDIRPLDIISTSTFTLLPCPAIEYSEPSSSGGAFSSAYRTIILPSNTTSTAITVRLTAVKPGLTMSVAFWLVSTALGGFRLPSSVVKSFNTTVNFVYDGSSNISTYSSRSVSIPMITNGRGGVFEVQWQLISCSASADCYAPGPQQSMALIQITATSPLITLSPTTPLPVLPQMVWSATSSSLSFVMQVSTIPISSNGQVQAVVQSNCSFLRFIPSRWIWGVVPDNHVSPASSSVTVVSQGVGYCTIYANVTCIGEIILPSTSMDVLGVVSFAASVSYSARYIKPVLDVYPGDSFAVMVERQSIDGTFVADSTIQLQIVQPSGLLNLPSSFGQTWPVVLLSRTSSVQSFSISVVSEESKLQSAIPPNTSATSAYSTLIDFSFNDVNTVTVPIGRLLPSLNIVVRKALSVVSYPTLLATGAIITSPNVLVWMPQATVGYVNVTTTCNYSTSYTFSASVSITYNDRVADSDVGLTAGMILAPPDTLSDDTQLSFNTTWSCTVRLSQGSSIDVVMVPFSFSLIVVKRGRASIDMASLIIRPKRTYNVNVTISSSRYSRPVSLLPWSTVVNGTALTLTPIGSTQSTSPSDASVVLTQCFAKLVVPAGAASTSLIILALQLNDTFWFRNPSPKSLELAPLITATASSLPSSFLFAQPVGTDNAQWLSLQLSSLPREDVITAVCSTTPARNGGKLIALFSPASLIWDKSALLVTNQTTTTQSFQLVGVVPNTMITLSCTLNSPAAEFDSPTPNSVSVVLLNQQSMQFMPLLSMSLSIVNFLGVLFVGSENQRSILVRISTLPSQNVSISFSVAVTNPLVTPRRTPDECVVIGPQAIMFLPVARSDLVQLVNLSATCDTSIAAAASSASIKMDNFANITVTGVVQTAATNFDRSPASLNQLQLSFPILPKRVVSVVDPDTYQPINTVVVYCGGSETSTTLLVNVSALPMDRSSIAVVSLVYTNVNDSAMRPSPSAYATPATLQYSLSLTTSLSRLWTITCDSGYFKNPSTQNLVEDSYSATLQVQAPTEFLTPGPVITMKLKQLRGATVRLPTDITQGSQTISLLISPDALPDAGKVLIVNFVSSCPSAISLQHSNQVTWVPGMADSQQALRVIASQPVQNCVIALELSDQSTARNYFPTLFQGTVTIHVPSTVSWLDAPISAVDPSIFSNQVNVDQGVTLVIGVDAGNAFSGVQYWTPVVVYGITSFSDPTALTTYAASQVNSGTTAPVYIMSNVPTSGESGGLLSLLRTNPNAIKWEWYSPDHPERLNLTIRDTEGKFAPPQDEIITLLFTKYAMSRSDAPLAPNGNNISFYVIASPDELSLDRSVTYSVAYVFGAVTSLFAGAALATRATHFASILDVLPCPSANWVTQKQDGGLSRLITPVPLQIGSDDDMGRYFAGAVYGIMLFFSYLVVRVILMFLVFARRLEMQTIADSSSGVAMSRFRFPSLEIFPALYLCGVVTHCTLKVIVYSSNDTYRTISGILLGLVVLCVPGAIGYLLLQENPAIFEASQQNGFFEHVFYAQGKWITDPAVLTIANDEIRNSFQRYLAKYGMLFEDFVGSTQDKELSTRVTALTSSKHKLYRQDVREAAAVIDSKRRTVSVIQHTEEEGKSSPQQGGGVSVRFTVSRYYLLFDCLNAILIAASTVYEPTGLNGCMMQCWILFALLMIPVIVLVVIRPYRYHLLNIVMALMGSLEATAVALKASALSTSMDVRTLSIAVNGCLFAAAGLIFVKCLMDVWLGLVRCIQVGVRRGYRFGNGIGSRIVSAALGDGDEFQLDHTIELDENVSMKDLLGDFLPQHAISSGNAATTGAVKVVLSDDDGDDPLSAAEHGHGARRGIAAHQPSSAMLQEQSSMSVLL